MLFVHMLLVMTGCHFIPIFWWGENLHSGEGWGVASVYYDNTTQPQNMLLLSSPWHNNLTTTSWFGGRFGQPMPIAMHPLIGHDLPYWGMCGNWHGLTKMAAKRHCHEQQCKAARRHPLSLVDNIKIYFINNTRYFNARLNYIINLD